MALESPADELFYGGAAGGGKTGLLCGTALTRHRKSIIYRRQYQDIKEIEEQVEEILGDATGYNQNRKIWKLPGGDHRQLEFGACAKPGSEKAFMGRPHDLKAFDEIPQFTEQQYLFLTGWNRTTMEGQRCRVIAAGNPPMQPEEEWIIERWAAWLDPDHPDPALPGELRWYIRNEDGKDEEVPGPKEGWERPDNIVREGVVYRPRSRTFVPARTTDNPLLNEEYLATLQSLPEPLRSYLLYGSFDLKGEENPWQVFPTKWVEAAMDRWRKTPRPEIAMSALGVDVARGGRDNTVLSPRWGPWFGEQIVEPGKNTPDGPSVAALVMQHVADSCSINIDILNVGGSPFDILSEQDVHPVLAMNASNATDARDKSGRLKMRNKRAEWHWRLREALDPDAGYDVCLPPSKELKRDLLAVRFKLTIGGIQVESKEDLVKRLGRSTDYGDSIVMAAAEDSMVVLTDEHFAPLQPSPQQQRTAWHSGAVRATDLDWDRMR